MFVTHRRTWVLLALAALGAAGMFLGPDGWMGIDIGPVGAAVLYAALWLFVVHLSRNPDGVFPPDASLAERQGWTGLFFVTLIGLHFVNFAAAIPALGAAADQISNAASRPFGINLGMLIFGWIVVAGILRAQNCGGVELDERDLRIQHAAQRLASGLMSALLVGLIVMLAMFPDALRPWLRPLIVGNALIGVLIVQTLVEHISLVARYRRARA